ncbi:MAG TPA: hypothetical protein VF668_11780 [Pyrinomonadaceae bacterium]|jgi:hypothetical protein
MLAADAYTAYAELRRLGALSQTEEVRSAVASLTLLGGDEVKPLIDFYRFISDNAEALGESRVVVAFMPSRAGLPQGVAAVEFESPEAAAAFEPKLRRLVGQQARQLKQAVGLGNPAGAAARGGEDARQRGGARADADFALRRSGRWLVSADAPFTFKRLRGGEDDTTLAGSARFQSVRSRFANASFFVYVDTNVAQQAWALQTQRAQEQQQQPPVVLAAPAEATTAGGGVDVATGPEPAAVAPSPEPTPEPMPEATPEPTPEESGAGEAPPNAEAAGVEPAGESPTPEPEPSAEELAARGLSGVMRNLWGGVPRIPGAVAFGLGLDRGAVTLRVAVENTPDGAVAVIPFLPNVLSGAPVSAEAAAVAPADAELFVAGSLDWVGIYNSTLGAASVNAAGLVGSMSGGEEGGGAGERQPTADETIAAVEKLFGFKFKEDLLPSLGAEVAFSMPLDAGDFSPLPRGARAPAEGEGEKEEERDAEPGPLFYASLNNTAKMREILPRVFVALGFVSAGAPQPAPEKRQGFEIRTLGASDGLSYAILGDFLVVGELRAVRHCVDKFASGGTLAASNAYRDATAWQARQKIVHLFLADTLFRRLGDETRRRSGASTDPVVLALLAQLEASEYAPASYEATNEGDFLFHELRLPVSLVKSYSTAMAVQAKDAPVISGEFTAFYVLLRIAGAESSYKDEHKKGRYGTLEELTAEGLLEKDFLQDVGYTVEVSASGDRFEATATPKTYGKTGRRSFFVDETGKMRAADRKGERATASDPTTEH